MRFVNKIKLWFKQLVCKHKDENYYLYIKPYYRCKGSIHNNKGGYVLRYNVYEYTVCKNCGKYRNYRKIHSNIKYNTLITKYGIKL